MEPGRYGPGSLREFVSNPLPETDLVYLRSLQVSPQGLKAQEERMIKEIQSDLDSKYPIAKSPAGRRPSTRDRYAAPVPTHHPRHSERVSLGPIRSRGSSGLTSSSGEARRPSTQNGRMRDRTPVRAVSIELLSGPPIPQVKIVLFTKVVRTRHDLDAGI